MYTLTMYLAIDIGGSKTLVAVFSDDGKRVYSQKFLTDGEYRRFLDDLKNVLAQIPNEYKIGLCCCAIPAVVDHKKGIGTNFGNLTWHNVSIKADLEKILEIPVLVENDAKLGGLYEVSQLHRKYNKVLYLTIGTGIGSGIIIDGKIDPDLDDAEAGQMELVYEGKPQKWESFASGKALVKRFGKKASEINDPAVWSVFAHDLALGIGPLLSIIQPDVVIIGGGVGAYFEKFGKLLDVEVKKLLTNLVEMPSIVKAKKPEEAVIYGCYELIKQNN